MRYDADRNTAFVAAQRAVFTPGFLARHRNTGCKTQGPIFVVGLARSGSTLIEQILSCHSQVEATMELPNVNAILERLDGPYPESCASWSPESSRRWARNISTTRAPSAAKARRSSSTRCRRTTAMSGSSI